MTRLARFRMPDGAVRCGRFEDAETLALFEGDLLGARTLSGEEVALNEVQLLAPVAPPNVLAIGLNYSPHAEESNEALPERPILFIKANTAVCGPGDAIVLPAIAPNEVDYECELAVMIGKEAYCVSEDEALDYVLGYTCGNDVSQRACQLQLDRQWARGKSFDTFCPLGPWIETDIDPENTRVRSRLNGETMQDGNTADLIFSVRTLVSFLSQGITLLPGTVIMSGTPAGVGHARDPQVYLRSGDVIEVEIDGIGVLQNTVVGAK